MSGTAGPEPSLPPFSRRFFRGEERQTAIGPGPLGGKAAGLLFIRDELAARLPAGRTGGFDLAVPIFTVLGAGVFDLFLERNGLCREELARLPDDRIAHFLQRAEAPVEFLGDLRSLVEEVRTPLAVRSSSVLEDDLLHPFAGVYATKMIPNDQFDADTRFRILLEAVKLVWASTFFRDARSYLKAAGLAGRQERMAVIIQEVVGRRHGPRFYPDLSGVARSWNFYPQGHARPEQGVVQLALGLGKAIVGGERCWTYCPAYPRAAPPFASARDRMRQTQSRFWAVRMGAAREPNPIEEDEHLAQGDLADAEADGALEHLASTYDAASDRLVLGLGPQGPRVLDFGPLLRLDELGFTGLAQGLLQACEEAVGAPVEIEFAAAFGRRPGERARFGFLQVRPLMVARGEAAVAPEELQGPQVLLASNKALGHGRLETVRDVVYIRPERFDASRTPAMAAEVGSLAGELREAERPFVLIGFGRWGSSDPWLGIPVSWGQIAGVRVLVEASLPAMDVEPSQGSHFFHNLTSLQVFSFTVHHAGPHRVDWEWLDRLEAVRETPHVRWVSPAEPLRIEVDGRTGLGVIWKGGPA